MTDRPIKIDAADQDGWISAVAELPIPPAELSGIRGRIREGELTASDRAVIADALGRITAAPTDPAAQLLRAAKFFVPSDGTSPAIPARQPKIPRNWQIVNRILRNLFAARGIRLGTSPAKVQQDTDERLQRLSEILADKGEESKTYSPLQIYDIAHTNGIIPDGVSEEVTDGIRNLVSTDDFVRLQPRHLGLLSAFLGEILLPPAVRDLPVTTERPKLGGGQIIRLASASGAKEQVTPGLIRYQKLGDLYERSAPDQPLKLKREGIHTWVDLKSFIDFALSEASDGEKIEVVIDQYNFSTLQPTAQFLREVTGKTLEYRNRSLTLVVRGDPMDPPTLYQFDEEGLHISSSERNEKAIAFWQTDPVRTATESHLAEHPEQQKLLEALNEAHTTLPNSNLGDFLARVIELYNQGAEKREVTPIDLTKRTAIFSKIEQLREGLRKVASEVLSQSPSHPVTQSPAVLHWDPVDTILRDHPANQAPENSWFSVGAGQMIATLELPRALMDRGALPLDFRLMASDKYFEPVWEINTHGRNQGLKDDLVNPPDRRRIYVVNNDQTDEALLTYGPKVVLLNLKAGDIREALSARSGVIEKLMPVLAAPAKAYTAKGRIAYLDVYNKLREISTELANRFVVMGGYFAAPWILQGRKVDMTLAGRSENALKIMAAAMSPETPDPKTGRADWELLNLKIIPNVELAAALQAGGANKNFLTYRSARRLMRNALQLDPGASGGEKDRFRQALEKEKNDNIEVGEEITARVAPVYKIETDHLWSPQGLIEDFRNCLPPNIVGMLRIRDELISILERGDLDAFKLLIRRIADDKKEDNLHVGGTRNARDGFIDEVIKYAYDRLLAAEKISADLSREAFREEYYPKDWKEKPQEGRNGIGPLLLFAQENGITLPKEVYDAWNLYNPDAIREPPPEKEREYAPPEGESLRPLWGLPSNFVASLGAAVSATSQALTFSPFSEFPLDKKFFKGGLSTIKKALDDLDESAGQYPEVTRRLIAIRKRFESLVSVFGVPNIPDENLRQAAVEFRNSITRLSNTLGGTDVDLSKFLTALRKVAQDLFRVELAIRQDLKIRLGLGTPPVRAQKPPRPVADELPFLPNMHVNDDLLGVDWEGNPEAEARRWDDWLPGRSVLSPSHQVTRKPSLVAGRSPALSGVEGSLVGARSPRPQTGQPLTHIYVRLIQAGEIDLKDELQERAEELTAEHSARLARAGRNRAVLVATAEEILAELGDQQGNDSPDQRTRDAALRAAERARMLEAMRVPGK